LARDGDQRRSAGVKGFAPGAAEAIGLVWARGRKRFQGEPVRARRIEIGDNFDAAPKRPRKIAVGGKVGGVSEREGGSQARKIPGSEGFILA
jgi:hypothetical protein